MTFTRGDFLLYRDGEMGSLQQVMLHELRGTTRLFAIILKVDQSSQAKDWVLKLPILDTTEQVEVIGLPAISGKRLYMLPVSGGGPWVLGGKQLLWVDWQIQFL